MLADMLSDGLVRFLLGLWGLAVVTVVVCGYLVIEDEKQFAAEHCHQISVMSGDLSPGLGISANGQPVLTTSMTPSKTGYACDNGQEYWH